MSKIAIYFPGIGYHCDKPLLYYCREIACEMGYENYRTIDYTYSGGNIRGNIEKMKEAVKYFEGEHDFKGFKASGTSSKSSVRTIYKTDIKKEGDRIIIELTGNGFLYNMVRIIAGTLVEVGLGKIKSEEIPEIINSKDRTKAGKTLPPYALYLVKVEYK